MGKNGENGQNGQDGQIDSPNEVIDQLHQTK